MAAYPSKLADRILDYHFQLRPDWELPEGVELLFPYDRPETRAAMTAFYQKYYDDRDGRIFLFGINPGRFGAGVTGIPFTDPVRLQADCDIPSPFRERAELSSDFVYRVVRALGGPRAFYGRFFITSVCPLGFLKNGKNYNYYDDAALLEAVRPHISNHLRYQRQLGANPSVAISVGRGKNFTLLQQLNEELGLFEKVEALPHPRWVMQYRRRNLNDHLQAYCDKLLRAASEA
jgi:hypothetical protein